ncbi:hypothetical protein HK105_208774 [Polyrhizophydium stewartii]|uniref:Uncharacterized protein n=1 Tax=Polyrhizophydium stewartii TaxID=2732419 RepID=A0ABR4MWX5_9FUNG
MLWFTPAFSVADIPDLAGKVVIVTGGSSGLGLASAVALAAKGAHVIVSCRNEDKGNAAVADIKAKVGVPAATVEFGVMEQSDLASVRRFADWFLAKGLRLDVLMLNAGVGGMALELVDGVETYMLVNHLSHMLLAQLLLPKLKESAPSRIVFVSSTMYLNIIESTVDWQKVFGRQSRATMDMYFQYSYSKLANLQTSNYLAHLLGSDSGVLVNTAHPGLTTTNVWHNKANPLSGTWLYYFFMQAVNMASATSDQAALTQLYVATHPDIEKNKAAGRFYVPTAAESGQTQLAQDRESQKLLWEVSEEHIRRILAEKGVPL